VLGHWGDTHGRKNVLVLCMFLMGFFDHCWSAVLPTYEQVGIWAPICWWRCGWSRVSRSREKFPAQARWCSKHAPFGRRGFFASFTLQGVQAGQILAAAVFLADRHLYEQGPVRRLGLAHPVPA